ncbi:ATP-binding protein [Paraburkholderia sp. SOS3]|uniref:ATP-binding protein n=1 Tax=Paraburkholderia sp. SOS3 TaxID=1926494 RepID=UPI000B228F60|nr:ATP-binding protein [Paraburkholderia sp. SOS3]
MAGHDRRSRVTMQNDPDARARLYRSIGRSLRRWIVRALMLAALFAVYRAVFASPALIDAAPSSGARSTQTFPRKLTIGVLASGWSPFEEFDDGELTGLSVDYLRALAGPDVEFDVKTYADMPQLLAAACANQIDVLMSVARTPEREHCVVFTAPYFEASTSVVTRTDDVDAPERVRSGAVRVAVERGFLLDSVLRERFPRARIDAFEDTAAALHAVERGDDDVYFGYTPAVQHYLAHHEFAALKVVLEERPRNSELRFAVPRSRTVWRNDLNRALTALPAQQAVAIRTRWIADAQGAHTAAAMPAGDDARKEGNPTVTALRLLPLLIGIGVTLLVTLRAYSLLQREVRRREQTERELAAQLNFQQTMMEMVPYPLVAKDLNRRYIAVNQAFERLTGLSRAAVIGRTSTDVLAWGEENIESLERLTAHSLATGERAEAELQFADHAGDDRRGLFSVCICHDVDGAPSCVLGTLIDITDIRRAEMLARETERRLFDVTRSLPAVVFQLRRAPDGAYSFPYIGGDTKYWLGRDSGTLIRGSAVNFGRVSVEDRPLVMAALERSASAATPIHLEFRMASIDDSRWVRAELVPRAEADGGTVWSGYWVDASAERLRSDELARARDLAEAASRAKDDFLAMMSHEIRTPMNGVLGLVEVLERTRLDADQGEMLRMIHESAGALLQILDDLLDYSKIEAGRLTIEAEPLDLRDMVDTAVGLLAARAHEKGLKVRVDVEPQVAALMHGDSVRLRQILFNLLGNAIKFTPSGEVDVHVAVVRHTDAGQVLRITVEDTGIGIAPEVQARLFEPFVQAETSTTRRFGGTGLGLTICRKLVDLMGGTLELHSTPDVGTRMTLQLLMPVESPSYTVGGLRGKRGLVAVADRRVRQALLHFGAALGIELRAVSDGAPELRDAHALAAVDLVFIGDGFEVASHALPHARVIRLTEKPKPTGYRIVDDTVRVSVNPISWRGLGAACAAALTGLAPKPARERVRGEQIEPATPPDRERAIASGRLVLVAEDHPVNQELIRHQLALLGFACDVVNDGEEALQALERTRYGFLITDCHMPNLSGYELARRVRAAEAGGAAHLPIVGITANTAAEDLKACRDAGMDDCLIKPTRIATLREHLSRWIAADGHRRPGYDSAPAVDSDSASGSGAAPSAATEGRDGAAEPFVPVDLAHLTRIWGSESTVKALLDSFVSSVRDDVRALPPLLEEPDVDALRAWHHRVAGAVGVLQYPPLFSVLEDYRRGIADSEPERLRLEGLALVRKCNAMLDGIEGQAALLA